MTGPETTDKVFLRDTIYEAHESIHEAMREICQQFEIDGNEFLVRGLNHEIENTIAWAERLSEKRREIPTREGKR